MNCSDELNLERLGVELTEVEDNLGGIDGRICCSDEKILVKLMPMIIPIQVKTREYIVIIKTPFSVPSVLIALPVSNMTMQKERKTIKCEDVFSKLD